MAELSMACYNKWEGVLSLLHYCRQLCELNEHGVKNKSVAYKLWHIIV